MDVNELVKWLQEEFPGLVRDMQQTSHHYISEHYGVHINPFHIEGSVWAHQMMVMAQARDRNVNEAVKLACLGHDLGKPLAAYQNHEKHRVRFSGHEGFSVFLMEGVFKKMGVASPKDGFGPGIFWKLSIGTETCSVKSINRKIVFDLV